MKCKDKDGDSETQEELVNLADMIPNLVSVHRNMMYRGSGKLLATSPTKAYSSKVLGFQHYNADDADNKNNNGQGSETNKKQEGHVAANVNANSNNDSGADGDGKDGTQSLQMGGPTPRKKGPSAALAGGDSIIPMPNTTNVDDTEAGFACRRGSQDVADHDTRPGTGTGADANNASNSKTTAEDKNDPQPCASPDFPRILIPERNNEFKSATGCTNASDFIVRCLIARLRSGVTVVKHAHSRWAKSQMRTLFVQEDGRSLTWCPPIVGERMTQASTSSSSKSKSASKNVPNLDLRNCSEVRHAWTTDPTHVNFTGTKVLRFKCEAENAHKSFSLIFPDRTVDLTCMTADQCRVLMEGFSALCYRLQMAHPRSPSFTASVLSVSSKADSKKNKKLSSSKKKGSKAGQDNKSTSFDDKGTASETMTTKSGVDAKAVVPSAEFGH
jgi:hypothetical protein